MTIANLPMYDLPEIRHATDDWWSGLARAFRRAGISDVPDRLDRERAMPEVWRDPGLVLSQACGYPLLHDLAGGKQTRNALEPGTLEPLLRTGHFLLNLI